MLAAEVDGVAAVAGEGGVDDLGVLTLAPLHVAGRTVDAR